MGFFSDGSDREVEVRLSKMSQVGTSLSCRRIVASFSRFDS